MAKWLAAGIFVALLSMATAARAQHRRVAVLGVDRELARALDLALAPWGVETVPSATDLSSSPTDALQLASALARRMDAEAVVWVSTSERGSLLWVFDAHAGEVTTRILVEVPPFDGATAAAVALSVKTILRASVIAPPAERFGAPPPPAPEVEPSAAFEAGLAVTLLARDRLEPRLELAPVLWPADRLGLALEVSLGPGLDVDAAGYRGRYDAVVAGGEARLEVLRGSRLSASVSLGGAAHFTTLRGAYEDAPAERVRRLNGSLDVETLLSFRVASALYVGASGGVSLFPARRRYLVRGSPVFSPGTWAGSVGGYAGVALF